MDSTAAPALARKHAAVFFWTTGAFAAFAVVAWLVVPLSLVKLAVLGAVGSIVGLLVFAFPKHGTFLGIFWVYAGLSYYTSFPAVAPISFAVTAAVILRLLRGDSFHLKYAFFNWALAVFTVLVFQSFLFAYDYGYAFQALVAFAKSVLLVLVIVQVVRTERDLEMLALVVFAASFSTVILGLLNVKLGLVKDWAVLVGAVGWLRFGSTHINPNNAALYLVAGLPLGIYAVRRVRAPSLKVLLTVCCLGMVGAVIMTYSRQAVFPLAVVLVAVLLREAKSRWAYVGVGAGIVIAALLTPAYYWYRIFSIGYVFSDLNLDWSLALRLKALQVGWHLFLDHPFTGVGLNNFIVRSGSELVVRMGAHNGYLEILTGVGLFGFIAFLMMPAAAIRGFVGAIRAPWPERNAWMRDLSFYFLLSFIAVLIGVFFQHVHFYRIFWLPMAAGLVAWRLGRDADRAGKNPETRSPLPE
jgi:O-antigen ligase